MKDTKKPITLRKMKRMLKGRRFLIILGFILALGLFVWAIYEYSTEGFDLETMVIYPCVTLLLVVVMAMKSGRARRTIRHLRKCGELEEALADLNGEDVHRIPYIPEHSMQIAENVLGEKYIFLFSCGRIIRYHEIKSISTYTQKKKLIVYITYANGKNDSLLDLPSYRQRDFDECLRQLRARYPGCPVPKTIDEEIITL